MGIDYGRRRIGLAVTDEDGACIRGLATIDTKNTPNPLSVIVGLIRKENPGVLVVGLPLDSDDRETAMSAEIRSFAQKLAKEVTIPIHYIDESLTSRRASELLLFRKKKERRNKANVDRIAACLILEEYRKEQGFKP